MPRPERPLDPDGGPLVSFAQQLRDLRKGAGDLKYSALAARVGRSQTALSEAAGGTRFPTWEITEAYVTACGGDPAEWRTRWEEVNAHLRPAALDSPGDGITSNRALSPGPVLAGPRRRPRYALLAAGTAAVVVLGGGGIYALMERVSATPTPSAQPSPSSSAVVSLPSTPSPSAEPTVTLQAAIIAPAEHSVLQRCVLVTGTAKAPTGWELWLAIQIPDKNDQPERYYLVGRIEPQPNGSWKLPDISVGSEDDVDRVYWLKIVSADVSITGPLDQKDFNDVPMAKLPDGFDPTPLATVQVRRAKHNLPGQTCA